MGFERECHQLIGAAIDVHRALGPGLLESAYRRCLQLELRARGLHVVAEVPIPIVYRGYRIVPAYRADLVVAGAVIVEIKSAAKLEPVHMAQLLTYLRLTGLGIGYLLNFNSAVLRDGIRRVVL